jgi:hypothetical protein
MISALTFFAGLNWINGRPLVIEPYRQDIFRRALDERRPDGSARYNMIVCGRGKKNFKSADLVLAGLFCLMCRESPQGSDVLIVANAKAQAADDLSLAKKLVIVNDLDSELEILADEIRRKDGRGTMRIIPSENCVGQHGKTAQMIGYDEIHGQKNRDLMEALQPDPTRDVLQWITSYDTIYDVAGVPLHDLKQIGMSGSDPRMLFSWYSAELCTDPAFAHLPPDERANPSMASWPEGRQYLEQQRRRLPSSRFRRLHHNLPGAPQGAFYDQGQVERAIVAGRQQLEPVDGVDYLAAVDMSGGSNDDSTLSISHWDGSKAVVDLVIEQVDPKPFNPRDAVKHFAAVCRRYRIREIHGDAYAGETFRRDFSDLGIDYVVEKQTRTHIYESLEVALNAAQVELPDLPKLRRQLLTIVRRGASLDHMAGQHDDYVTAAALAAVLVNPDLGAPQPHMLTFYQRQVEAMKATATAPMLRQQHGGEAIMQNWQRRPSDGFVRVSVPVASSHLHVNGASYLVEVEGAERIAWLTPADALEMLDSASASALPFVEANRPLLEQLRDRAKAEGHVPRNRTQGVAVRDLLQAAEDARPKTRAEEVQAFLRYRDRYTNETLGRSPRR